MQVVGQTPCGGQSNSLILQVPPVGPTNLIATVSLSRVGGNLLSRIVVTNIGSKGAGNVQITGVTAGGVPCPPSFGSYPLSLGAIDPGGAADTGSVLLPVTPAQSAVLLKLNGTYASGTFGATLSLTVP